MNRKFINAFFAAALLLGSATVFSSCKDTNEDMGTELKADINRNKAELAALKDRLDNLGSGGSSCSCDLTPIYNRLAGLDNASDELIKALNAEITAIEQQVAVTVTSLELQAVENPAFGSFSLPLDLKTNMLVTYYGAYDAEFPNVGTTKNIGATLDAMPTGITKEEIAGPVSAIGTDAEGNEVENYIGTVYMTVNPTSVDAANENLAFSLVNSQDANVGGIELSAPALSSKVLEFGFGSRAGNGFYEAAASAKNIDEIKVEIVDGLAEAVKDALKDHTKADAKQLLQLVIAQLRANDFPALGIKADYKWNEVSNFTIEKDPTTLVWDVKTSYTTNEKSASTYSEYAIAAAAIHPLSFNFMEGISLDKLPTLPDLGDFDIADYFTFEVKPATVDPITATVSIKTDAISITIEPTKIYDAVDKNVVIGEFPGGTYTAEGLGQLQNDLQEAMSKAMGNATESIQKAINDMVKDINDQLDANFKKVNDKIAAASDKVQPWIDRANVVINRVNGLLKNPNHFLQVCALYENGEKIGRMSNTSAVPTYFPGGGASTLNVILTTYTLETVAPAYRKMYAVYKLDGANKTQVAAKIIPGTTSRVAIGGLQDGSKYEVVYQAIDYSGYTSTQKFYFEIGK